MSVNLKYALIAYILRDCKDRYFPKMRYKHLKVIKERSPRAGSKAVAAFVRKRRIYVKSWIIKYFKTPQKIKSILLHELTHCYLGQKSHNHDIEFARKICKVYKKEFKEKHISVLKNEYWDLNGGTMWKGQYLQLDRPSGYTMCKIYGILK